MKRKTSRALSLILAAVFLFALLPTMAFAAVPGEVEVTTLVDLQTALAPENPATTIKVTAEITAPAETVLDVLDGKTVIIPEGGSLLLGGVDADAASLIIRLGEETRGDLRVEDGGILKLETGLDQIVTEIDLEGEYERTSMFEVAAGGTLYEHDLAVPYIAKGNDDAVIDLQAGEIIIYKNYDPFQKVMVDGFATALLGEDADEQRAAGVATIQKGKSGDDFIVGLYDMLMIDPGAELTVAEGATLITKSFLPVLGTLIVENDVMTTAFKHVLTEGDEGAYLIVEGGALAFFAEHPMEPGEKQLAYIFAGEELHPDATIDYGNLFFTNELDGYTPEKRTAFFMAVGDGERNANPNKVTINCEWTFDGNDAIQINSNGVVDIVPESFVKVLEGGVVSVEGELNIAGALNVTGDIVVLGAGELNICEEADFSIGEMPPTEPDSSDMVQLMRVDIVGRMINAGTITNDGAMQLWANSEFMNYLADPEDPSDPAKFDNGELINNGQLYGEYLFTHIEEEDIADEIEPNGVIINKNLLTQPYLGNNVTFFANNGIQTEYGDCEIVQGKETLTLPKAVRGGYAFRGWLDENDPEKRIHAADSGFELTGDASFSAQWLLLADDTPPATPPSKPPVTTPITPPASWVNPFTDVSESDWFYEAVKYCNQNKLMDGVSANEFRPTGIVSRAEVWQVLANLAGIETDTTKAPWYTDAQAWAVSVGITDGTKPTEEVTREQLVTMLYRYYTLIAKGEFEGGMSAKEFEDFMLVSDWAELAIQWGVTDGIIEGVGGNRLNPGGDASRAELATMLMRFNMLLKK